MSIFSSGRMQTEARDAEVLVAMHMAVGNFVLHLMFSGPTDHTDDKAYGVKCSII